MKLVPVKCEGCNAPIRIPRDVSFVTCRFCHSRLEIDYSDERAEARLVGQLKRAVGSVREQTQQVTSVARRVEYQSRVLHLRNRTLRLQRSIDRLDERWRLDRQQYLIRVRGVLQEPGAIMPIFRLLVATGISVAIVAAGFRILPSYSLTVLVAVGLILLLYGLRCSHLVKHAFAYADARRDYEHRRGDLEHRLRLNDDDLSRLTNRRR